MGSYAAYASQISAAAQKYGIDPYILAGTLAQESGFNPSARHTNANGTVDRGIAQLNSAYYPKSIATNTPAAIDKAAQILAGNLHTCGSYTGAITAYNSGSCSGTTTPGYLAGVLSHAKMLASSNGGSVAAITTSSPTSLGKWLQAHAWILFIIGFLLLLIGLLRLTK